MGVTRAEGALIVWALTEYADDPHTTQANRDDANRLAHYVATAVHLEDPNAHP